MSCIGKQWERDQLVCEGMSDRDREHLTYPSTFYLCRWVVEEKGQKADIRVILGD